jgi:hypothetical protein
MPAAYSIALILVNTVALSADYSGASDEYRRRLDMVNYVCVVLFVSETTIKLLSLGAPQ